MLTKTKTTQKKQEQALYMKNINNPLHINNETAS